MNKEAAELVVGKAMIDRFGDEEWCTEHINLILAKNISEKIYHIIETNGEVIIGLTEGTDTNYSLDSNQFVFRKIISWQPLIRCKDCKYYLPISIEMPEYRRCLIFPHRPNTDYGYCDQADRCEKTDDKS